MLKFFIIKVFPTEDSLGVEVLQGALLSDLRCFRIQAGQTRNRHVASSGLQNFPPSAKEKSKEVGVY